LRKPRQVLELGLVFLVAAAGLGLRLLYLDAQPFWVDEAESSINALTILQKGYPADVYLGQPIYENTLLWTWPESVEYEFRDVSYSERGFAVYHGWLPLYLIAGSFALYGIQPDEADASRTVKHDLAGRKRRTRAARLPGAIFGMLFLFVIFLGGKILYGRDAAWAALIVGCIFPFHISMSRQARYYSLEILLTTACCIVLWLLLKECKWKHVLLSALVFVLLFHTHLLSFLDGAAVAALITPWIIRRHVFAVRKLAALAALVAAGTLPWVFVTGFYHHQVRIPRAWPLLHLPADFLRYPPLKLPYMIFGLVVVCLTGCVALGKARIPSRIRDPIARQAPVLVLLGLWAACAYSLFLGFIPAVSFSSARLNLSYWGPMFLLGSVICASLARIAAPRFSGVVASAIMLLLFYATGHEVDVRPRPAGTWEEQTAVFNYLDGMRLDGASRIYAAPNSHLVLSFYSGLPIQSISPVRKSFLDSYRGDIVYIDSPASDGPELLGPLRVRLEAFRYGEELSPAEAERWSVLLESRNYRAAMAKTIGSAEPLETVPHFARELMGDNDRLVRSGLLSLDMELFTRGFELHNWSEWRAAFEYRYVDPLARSGSAANYAERLRGSEAVLLSGGGAAVYRSHWRPPGPRQPARFEFEP
jgi:hypothetical protein